MHRALITRQRIEHNHKMPPMPFVHRNIYTLMSMLSHASPIFNRIIILYSYPTNHNRMHTILLSRGQTAQSTIPHHTNIMDIRFILLFQWVQGFQRPNGRRLVLGRFLQSRHRTRTLQTKQHLVEYNLRVHRTRSGQECAPSHRPAKIRNKSNPTTRRLPREV